jgi:glyoxylate/hydroxypyruvate reductase A
MTTILFAAGASRWSQYEPHLRAALDEAGIPAALVTEARPDAVDFMIYAPGGDTPADFTPFNRCKAVLSLWAGVERIVGNPTLTQPLCRMVDPALTQGMVEYVTGHVLRAHLQMDDQLQNGQWDPVVPPLSHERRVAMLGMGALGTACAQALRALGFDVQGWARTARPGCHHGPDGLRAALTGAQVAVTLMPATAETENLLDARSLSWLAPGATVINPGRGTLIDDEALLAALGTGQVGRAVLDVFRTEPLPPEHPFWAHPRVFVTPHVAAETRPASASRMIVENIRRALAGEALLHQVDRGAGY